MCTYKQCLHYIQLNSLIIISEEDDRKKLYAKASRKVSFCYFLLFLFLLNIAGQVRADCSCSPNYPPYDSTANEFTATSCVPDTNGRYYYKWNVVRCDSASIQIFNSYSYIALTPDELAGRYSGFKILRNKSGTHIFVITTHYPPLATLSDENVPSSSGVHIFPVLDKYCTYFPVQDSDNDGYPDCLDCIPNDPTNEDSCLSTPKNLGKCAE